MLESDEKLIEAYRTCIQENTNWVNVVPGGAERLHDHQVQAIEDALSGQVNAAKRIEAVKSIEELQEIQTARIRDEMEKAVVYWSCLYALARMNLIEATHCLQSSALEVEDGYLQTLGSNQASA